MNICNLIGHKPHDPDLYARFFPPYHAIDGIGGHHRVIEYQCERCNEWTMLCRIHTTALEGHKTQNNKGGLNEQPGER